MTERSIILRGVAGVLTLVGLGLGVTDYPMIGLVTVIMVILILPIWVGLATDLSERGK